jgi:hypothetical protein
MSQIPVTLDQIRKAGYQIESHEDSKLIAKKGKLTVIWEAISSFKFKRVEAFTTTIA